MAEKGIIPQLRTVHLFSSLEDVELRKVGDRVKVKRFRKNEIILYEKDTCDYMYVILSGKVKAVQITRDGKETILAMHGQGDSFGELSIIDCKTVPATVIAVEDTETALVHKEDFYYLIATYEKVLENLLGMFCARLRKSWDMIQLLNFNNASQRLKMLFAALSEEHGRKTAEGIVLGIRLTHKDIANMAGVARETVTRVMDRWLKNKEITILKNKLIRLSTDFIEKDLKLDI